MTWVPKPGTNLIAGAQVVSIEGSSYNPCAIPVQVFVRRFKEYWRAAHPLPNAKSVRPSPNLKAPSIP
jgi:hypothetical protein